MCVKNDRCAHRGCVSNVIYAIFNLGMEGEGKEKEEDTWIPRAAAPPCYIHMLDAADAVHLVESYRSMFG